MMINTADPFFCRRFLISLAVLAFFQVACGQDLEGGELPLGESEREGAAIDQQQNDPLTECPDVKGHNIATPYPNPLCCNLTASPRYCNVPCSILVECLPGYECKGCNPNMVPFQANCTSNNWVSYMNYTCETEDQQDENGASQGGNLDPSLQAGELPAGSQAAGDDPPVCFSSESTATILTENGPTETALKDIRAGDKILAFDENGNAFYDEVYYACHIHEFTNSDVKASMRNFHFKESASPLRASGHHMIYLSEKMGQFTDTCIDMDGQKMCVYEAQNVEVGDELWRLNPETNKFEPMAITAITHTLDQFRSPLTLSGNVVVDGVAASAYAKNHRIGSITTLPGRIGYHLCGDCTNHIYGEYLWTFLNQLRYFFRPLAMKYGEFVIYAFYASVCFVVAKGSSKVMGKIRA